MPKHMWMAVFAMAALVAASGCGDDGSGSDVSSVPTLAGTAIPTVTVVPSPTPACDAPAAGETPANLPADVPIPPDSVVDRIQMSPHLQVVLRVTPPRSAEGRQPYTVLAAAMVDQLRAQGWTMKLNTQADGSDWDFSKDDGRTGHLNIVPYVGCPEDAKLTLDLLWITG
jgi:hypothetical protein